MRFNCEYIFSFTRRMRRWGFHRIETTNQRAKGLIIFTCPRFRRGRPDMCKRMCDDRQYKVKPRSGVGLASLADLSPAVNSAMAAPTGLYANGVWNSMAAGQMPMQLGLGMLPQGAGMMHAAMPLGYHNSMTSHSFTDPALMQSGMAFGHPMMAGAAGGAGPRTQTEIQANLGRINAELFALSRLRQLNQQTISLEAARNTVDEFHHYYQQRQQDPSVDKEI